MLAQLADGETQRIGRAVIRMPLEQAVPRLFGAVSVAVLMLSISIVFIDDRLTLVILALLITMCVQIILGGSIQAFFFPIRRFWLLFLFVACLLLFLPYGKKVPWAPWFTDEGVHATVKQWLRLWTWLQISFIFAYFKLHAVIFRALDFFFKSHKSTLYSGLLAVEDFPGVFDIMGKRITMEFRFMLRHPISASKHVFIMAFNDVADYVCTRHAGVQKEMSDKNE
jgi:hypothetical protein